MRSVHQILLSEFACYVEQGGENLNAPAEQLRRHYGVVTSPPFNSSVDPISGRYTDIAEVERRKDVIDWFLAKSTRRAATRLR
jgi:hypothetical protein